MLRPLLISLVTIFAVFAVGCQITVDDIQPVHLRGGGESPEPETKPQPEPQPKPEPPKNTGKDVVYVLGLNGID